MNETVLRVEDNEDNQAIYRAVLEHGGFTVPQAWDGVEGIQMARERMPRLILMDLAIPRMGWKRHAS